MDQHFKILRAREAIERLNIEVKRVATQLHDEAQYLQYCEESVRTTEPLLAHQIAIYRNIRGRFAAHHHRRLVAISKLQGFSGSIEPGESLDTARGGSASRAPPVEGEPAAIPIVVDEPEMTLEEEELEEEEADDEEDMQDSEDIMDILSVAMDKTHV